MSHVVVPVLYAPHVTQLLAQETLCQLAKLVSLYRPNGRIRAIPVHRQLVTDRVARNSGTEFACKGTGTEWK